MNKPKAIGTKAETAVARYLQAHGFPHAERRSLRGVLDAGDITGCPGVCIEVKGGDAAKSASDLLVADWLAETEAERVNAGADIGLLVLQRRGVGPANAGRWWAVLTLPVLAAITHGRNPVGVRGTMPVRVLFCDAVRLLRGAGYGQPLLDEEVGA